MKGMKWIAVMLLFALMCTIAEARQSIVTSADELKIDLVKYDPSPVQPGSTVDIWFEVTNIDNVDINSLAITLPEKFPFAIKSSKTIYISKIQPEETKSFKYQVYVSKDATASSYNMALQFYSDKILATTSESFSIGIVRSSQIMSTSVEIEAGGEVATAIAPGQNAKVKFKIQNSDNAAINDITVKLELGATTIPFAPLGMTAEQKISSIGAGKEEFVEYNLIALPDAAAGVYKIPVNIKYYDSQGYSHNTSDIIGLVIGASPDIAVEISESELTTSNKLGKATVKVINQGTTDIKFMRISILPGEDYEIISSSSVYMGDVDSDDYETADFRIKMLKNSAEIKLSLDYKDANNNAYVEEVPVAIKLYSPSEMGLQGSSTWIFVLVILLALGGYIAYKKLKKKKKHTAE